MSKSRLDKALDELLAASVEEHGKKVNIVITYDIFQDDSDEDEGNEKLTDSNIYDFIDKPDDLGNKK